ncbi:hypothetical protein [Planosporangium mesophilum]|uniref:hypothetical protein n=1 Tax=Planosporangium mesophilum TaxID=689768 RepID=UPI00194ED894|nr:hypothetical protein [Planosporangium mesophilum]
MRVSTSSVTGSDGTVFTVTNHLVTGAVSGTAEPRRPREWLVVWAGDRNVVDTTGADIRNAPLRVTPAMLPADLGDALPGPDFLAVIDADRGSPTYGKVVNTATVGPLVENEPHHMQYIYHRGDKIFAGGLFSSATYVFDVGALPDVKLSGVTLPTDTACGSVPDAYWVLSDHTAYGTYMGGPVLPGPCVYSNGAIRFGNGYAGTPGEVVRIGPNGAVLSQTSAAQATPEDPARCVSVPPLLAASCANPHGIQVREDLNRMVTSDYAEPRDILFDPVKTPSPYVTRNTVRTWDIADRNAPRLASVSVLPDGPRTERNPAHEENSAAMETTVTNLPNHRGAFVATMCGGVIYYAPDITVPRPVWREVFDDTTAARAIDPTVTEGAGCDGGGWVQTSLDDRYLYHAVIGRSPGSQSPTDAGSPKMVYALDISALLASGGNPSCAIDDIREVYDGGAEADCPRLVSTLPVDDVTTGGPHWGTLDNFRLGDDGYFHETTDVRRIAISNYFVARSGIDGNHKVCMVDADAGGRLSLDTSFRDENEGTVCVTFNRTHWPHGDHGAAKPHAELFVVADDDLR